MRIRRTLAVTTAGCAVLAGSGAALADDSTPKPTRTYSSLHGTARLAYPAPDNDVRVSVDARAVFPANGSPRPERSSGTIRIYHRFPLGDGRYDVNWGVLRVDCMTTGGPTATVTGVLVKAAHYWHDELIRHVRMGVSFYVAHKGASRVGLSGSTDAGQPRLTPCMAPAADATVIAGGYRLRDKATA